MFTDIQVTYHQHHLAAAYQAICRLTAHYVSIYLRRAPGDRRSTRATVRRARALSGVDTEALIDRIQESVVERSPYPGVVFDEFMTKTGQAMLFKGRYKGEKVAIKIFLANARETYDAECRLLEAMPRHASVATMFGHFLSPWPCLLTTFIEGGDLESFLRRNGTDTTAACAFAYGIASGIKHLHAHNIAHRDLKPANVLLSAPCKLPVLIDFGLSSRETTSYGTAAAIRDVRPSDLMGTPGYMVGRDNYCKGSRKVWLRIMSFSCPQAPELITGRGATTAYAIDMFALSMTIWHILAGQLPFPDATDISEIQNRIVAGERPPIDGSWPAQLVEVMTRCWRENPAERLTIDTAIYLIEQAAAGLRSTESSRSLPPTKPMSTMPPAPPVSDLARLSLLRARDEVEAEKKRVEEAARDDKIRQEGIERREREKREHEARVAELKKKEEDLARRESEIKKAEAEARRRTEAAAAARRALEEEEERRRRRVTKACWRYRCGGTEYTFEDGYVPSRCPGCG